MSDALDLTPKTWSVGEIVTAAELNSELRDKIIAVANRLDDTGWIDVSASISNPALAVYGTGWEPKYRIKNGICYFHGALRVVTTATWSGAWITLPPETSTGEASGMNYINQASGNNHWYMQVNSDGTCTAERYGPAAISVDTWLPFTACWPVAVNL